MKSKIFLSLLFSFSFYLLSSQVPQGFNYQAIARDGSSNVIANQAMTVRITLQSAISGGTVLYQETHSLTTTQFGLMTFIVGTGTPVSGTFSAINWQAQSVFIKTEIQYPGPGYTTMGTSPLSSVPYSMLAKDLEGPLNKLGVSGTTTNLDEALFEVKNNTGQTVFAVYNEGVRVYVDDGVKGVKGGFAIGGFGTAKAPSQEYMRVTRDSTRIYVNPAVVKGNKGGFAIGGFGTVKGTVDNFLDVSSDNYFIGYNSGKQITTGKYNSFVGYKSGMNNTSGGNNSFLGYQAGMENITGTSNTMIGTLSGQFFTSGTANTFLGASAGNNFQNGSYNVFIGSSAGAGGDFTSVVTGAANNVAVGNAAGYRLNTGANNVFLGFGAGLSTTGGNENVFLGTQSGILNSTGSYNAFVGYKSGYSNQIGINNNFMGYQAGYSNTVGNNNVFMGTSAGYSNIDGFSNTYIGNAAGFSNTSGFYNIGIGEQAGTTNTIGTRNVFLGQFAGRYNSSGSFNVFIGQQSGEANTTGSFNLFAGRAAGNFNTTGIMNTYLGINAGNSNTTGQENLSVGGEAGKLNVIGSNNVNLGIGAGYGNTNGNSNIMLGYYTGISLGTGNNNIFIGQYAGGGLANVSDRLFIENSGADQNNALVYGDFSTDFLRLNANVEVRNTLNFPNNGAVLWVGGKEALWFNGTYFSWGFGGTYNYFGSPVTIGTAANPGAYKLYVAGSVYATGLFTSSDVRYKKNITELTDVLESIQKLRSVHYDWDTDDFPDMKFDKSTQLGFIAQEVEPYFPELVKTDEKGFKSMDYSKMTVVLFQAVKEQQKLIEDQKVRMELSADENRKLQSELDTLKERMDRMESLLSK